MILKIKTTENRQVLDITDLVNLEIRNKKLNNGLINLFLFHATYVTIISNLDLDTGLDMIDAFSKQFKIKL